MEFSTDPEDDDFILERLTNELADELRPVSDVGYVPLAVQPGDKGVGEVVSAALSVLIAINPDYLRLLIEAIAAFTSRNVGRRVQLTVGDAEITIDRPQSDEVETLIKLMQSAVARRQI